MEPVVMVDGSSEWSVVFSVWYYTIDLMYGFQDTASLSVIQYVKQLHN